MVKNRWYVMYVRSSSEGVSHQVVRNIGEAAIEVHEVPSGTSARMRYPAVAQRIADRLNRNG